MYHTRNIRICAKWMKWTSDVHSHIRIPYIYKEHRNLEIRKHITTSLFRYETFYYLWVKGFDIRRETQSLYAVFIIWPLSRAAPIARKFAWLRRASESRPSRPASSFNSVTFFEIPQILRALPVRDVIRSPSSCSSSLAIVTSLSDTSALCAHALTPASSLHLTNPCAEPKGSQPN